MDDNENHGIPEDVGSKSRKKKQATPPRPVNQFMIYRAYMKDSVKAENPGVSNNEICESSILDSVLTCLCIPWPAALGY